MALQAVVVTAEPFAPQIAHHVADEHGFEDSDKHFYRFYSDEATKSVSRSDKKDEVYEDTACARACDTM
jgi:hypothetical protein